MFFFCFIAEFINGNYEIAEKYSQLIRRVPPELISGALKDKNMFFFFFFFFFFFLNRGGYHFRISDAGVDFLQSLCRYGIYKGDGV